MNAKKEQLLIDLQRHLNHCRDERATLYQDVMQLRIANEALRRELARERTWRQRATRFLIFARDFVPEGKWLDLHTGFNRLVAEIEAGE